MIMLTPTAKTPPTRCDEYFVPQKSRASKPPLNEVPYPKELKVDYGFSHLPEKFNTLVTLFNKMETIFQITHGRGQPETFKHLKENIEKNSNKRFTQKHLAQIISVYPAAYKLHRERPKMGKKVIQFGEDLFIQPNLQGNKDLAPFFDDFLASCVKDESNNGPAKTIKMNGNDEYEEEKSKWAMPLAAGESPKKSPLKRPAANFPPSPVKLISPVKSSRRNIDFVFRSPQKSPSTKPKMKTIFCSPLLDDRPKMDANRVTWRKMIFRHKLISRVREAHATFLAENKLEFEGGQDPKHWVHPLFKEAIEQIVPDILPVDECIPGGIGQTHLHTTDIRKFLQSVQRPPTIFGAERRDKTPEGRPGTLIVCKSEPNTPQTAAKTNPSVKFEPITPKTPLEQRLKARFAANAAALKAGFPEMQNRRAMLHKLVNEGGNGGILEVIRAHLNLEQRNSVGLDDAQFLSKLGREIRGASLLEHLRLLCELVSSTSTISSNSSSALTKCCCWLESVGKKHYFKISPEMGPHWIEEAKKAIILELANLEGKMRGLHRSPSSCFDDLN